MRLSKITFLFITCVFLLLPLEEIDQGVFFSIKTALCAILILTLGISHGAVDNILFQYEAKISTRLFVFCYLVIMGFVAGLWFIFPTISLLLFLMISAYHFGQSQLAGYELNQPISKLIYTSWGTAIISALIYFNQVEIMTMISDYEIFNNAFINILFGSSLPLFIGCTAVCFGLLYNATRVNKIERESILLETYVFGLIILAFALFNTLMGFTLYFIILHSLKVLQEEYDFLKAKSQIKNLVEFIYLLLPFTLFSILGLLMIYGVITIFDLSISIPILILLIVSCITVPHSVVMNFFYLHKSVSTR